MPLGGRRARVSTNRTKTPNPMLSFSAELLLVGSEQYKTALKS